MINSNIGGSGKKTFMAKFMGDEEKEKMSALNPMVLVQIWLDENGLGVDLEEVKGYGNALSTLKQFVKREEAALEEALGA